jgi:hypothetical protein
MYACQSFLSTATSTSKALQGLTPQSFKSDSKANVTINSALLRCGLSWVEEYDTLMKHMTKDNTTSLDLVPENSEQWLEFHAWHYRISLKMLVKLYEVSYGT